MTRTMMMGLSFDSSTDDYVVAFHHGLRMALATILLTFVLEVVSLRTVRDLLTKQTNGARLYRKALAANLLNHLVLGVPIYVASETLFCRNEDDDGAPSSLAWSLFRVLVILVVHSVGYYYAHRTMHTRPGWYKFHAFHHRFKEFIPPSSANAVGPVEYILAYIVPFFLGTVLVRPYSAELQAGVSIVSACNLLVHTPAMEAAGRKRHHNVLTTNYSAPTWNLDWMGMALRSGGSSRTVSDTKLE